MCVGEASGNGVLSSLRRIGLRIIDSVSVTSMRGRVWGVLERAGVAEDLRIEIEHVGLKWCCGVAKVISSDTALGLCDFHTRRYLPAGFAVAALAYRRGVEENMRMVVTAPTGAATKVESRLLKPVIGKLAEMDC